MFFLEFACFSYDAMDVGSLISGSSSFSKSNLHICKFLIHILLKPCLKDFEHYLASVQFSSVAQSTPWTAACLACLSITNSQSLLKLMSIALVMPSNHLILCHPLLLQPSIFPSIRVFSNESVLCIRRPKYWSFSFSISPSSEYSGLISFRITLLTCEIRWFPSANGKPLRKDRSTLSAATESQKHRSRSGQGTNSIYANSQVATNQL